MKEFENIILVSGSGRDCGKTTVACHIIGQLNTKGKVVGLKITPHFHVTDDSQEIIAKGESYSIFKEKDTKSNKDSSRMLRAGAEEVYFVQCNDEALLGIYEILKQVLPDNITVVCESGSFANVFKPELHILVEGTDPDKSKKSYISNMKRADVIVKFEEFMRNQI